MYALGLGVTDDDGRPSENLVSTVVDTVTGVWTATDDLATHEALGGPPDNDGRGVSTG